jgi:hypothetical protein
MVRKWTHHRRWERARDGLPEMAKGEKEGFEILWIF